MKQIAITQLRSDLKKMEDGKKELTYPVLMDLLEKYRYREAQQIRDAYVAGAKDGKDVLYMFDSPGSHYFNNVYECPAEPEAEV